MALFVSFSKEMIRKLHFVSQLGPRVSERWDNYYLTPKSQGKFPIVIKTMKSAGELTVDKIFRLLVGFQKGGKKENGHGYAIDHLEFRFYPRAQEEVEEKVFVLDFASCEKNEDISFSSPPNCVWRMEGTEQKGVIYIYDPESPPEISVQGISSKILNSFPVRVTAVGVEPISGASVNFPKYEVYGGPQALYDRRKNRNGSGWLEVVQTTKGERSWKYLNLKDLKGELPDDAAVLTASEERSKLAVKRDGEAISF